MKIYPIVKKGGAATTVGPWVAGEVADQPRAAAAIAAPSFRPVAGTNVGASLANPLIMVVGFGNGVGAAPNMPRLQGTFGTNCACSLAAQETPFRQIQEAGNATTGATGTNTLATTISTAAGDLIVVTVIVHALTVPAAPTISDTGGNTYTQLTDLTQGASRFNVFYTVSTASNTSVTATYTVGTLGGIAMSVQEVTGNAATSVTDTSITASGSSTAPNSGLTATTVHANDIAIGCIGWQNTATISARAFTAGTTTNNAEHDATTTTLTASVATGYAVVSTTGTQRYSGTLSASQPWYAAVFNFKASN